MKHTAGPMGAWLALALALLAAGGCSERLPVVYGQRGGAGAASVNGTAVLGDLFAARGHKVTSWRWLSPALSEKADVIVWFPDDFTPPSDEVREWLEQWLWDEDGRILIYVGRDFDAAPGYWQHVQRGAPAALAAGLASRLAAAQSDYLVERGATPLEAETPWFTLDGHWRPRRADSLEGDPRWLEGIDLAQLEIQLNGRFGPPPDPAQEGAGQAAASPETEAAFDLPADEAAGDSPAFPPGDNANPAAPGPRPGDLPGEKDSPTLTGEWDALHDDPATAALEHEVGFNDWDDEPFREPTTVVLASAGDPLVMRQPVGMGQLVVITNGSFLVNAALVNHQHRKLAARLLDEIEAPRRVVFLESSSGGPPVLEKDPSFTDQAFKLLAIAPFDLIFLHLAAAGLVYCFFCWPIFGQPQTPSAPHHGDFSQHVEAVAALLEQTADASYATNLVNEYRQRVHSAAGPPVDPASTPGPVRR